MACIVAEYEPQTVRELKAVLSNLPDDMPVSDALGELLCIRVFEDDASNRTLEFQ